MDTAWIQVFVLTLAECVAPAGKTVCQEQEFDLQFLTRADCEYALEQLVSLKDASENVIVDRNKSRCAVTARESEIFESLEAVSQVSSASGEWVDPDQDAEAVAPSLVLHEDRLASLPDCESYSGEGACKMGGIIVEAANKGQAVEIWRREQ